MAQTNVTARGLGLAALRSLRLRLLPPDGQSCLPIPHNRDQTLLALLDRQECSSPLDARLLLRPSPRRGVAAATLRAGRQAGTVLVEASVLGLRAVVPIRLQSLAWDSFGDGLPDVLRLESVADRERFRRWFTFLAEMQYYYPPAQASREVDDCAALIRYAFHEALRRHDGEWRRQFAAPVEFPIEDVEKYSYPRTPVGPAVFRATPPPLRPSDLNDGSFREFADAETLIRYNAHPVGRRAEAAQKGDLLVFYQPNQKQPYHTMVFVGASEALPDGVADWVVYHTGENGGQAGVIKKVPLSVLERHPAARWRPVFENANFLGFYRFNVLR